jgi:hypothetical protein
MEDKGQNKILAFDTLFTNNHIQMLKIFMSYLPPSHQNKLAVYIKFLELQYTLSFLKEFPLTLSHSLGTDEKTDRVNLYDELNPFCSQSEQNILQKMKNTFKQMENMQEILQIINMFQEMSPADADIFSGFSGLSGLSDIGSLDLSQLFELFQS